MNDTTLILLLKKSGTEFSEICLAMKKYGQGVGKWNGVGGKVEANETIEEAAVREAKEEIGIEIKKFYKVGEVQFYFPLNSAWNQIMHVFISEEWTGEPKESGEMAPRWFKINEIPFEQMWPDDIYWLPEVLNGNFVTGSFIFGKNDIILQKNMTVSKPGFPF